MWIERETLKLVNMIGLLTELFSGLWNMIGKYLKYMYIKRPQYLDLTEYINDVDLHVYRIHIDIKSTLVFETPIVAKQYQTWSLL